LETKTFELNQKMKFSFAQNQVSSFLSA